MHTSKPSILEHIECEVLGRYWGGSTEPEIPKSFPHTLFHYPLLSALAICHQALGSFYKECLRPAWTRPSPLERVRGRLRWHFSPHTHTHCVVLMGEEGRLRQRDYERLKSRNAERARERLK